MWDLKAVSSFIMLGGNVGIYNVYLYEFFYGTWETREAKALYYAAMVCIVSYLLYDTVKGYGTSLHLQANVCIFLTLIINFLFFALTLYDILPNHRLYLYTFNGTVFASTIVVLYLGVKYETFKL